MSKRKIGTYFKHAKRVSKKAKKSSRQLVPINLSLARRVNNMSRKKVKLVYQTYVSLNPGAGTVADYVFRANSPYDPDFTGAGHQPGGFDQWMALYKFFAVENAKITVNCYNNDTTYGQYLGITKKNVSTAITDPTQAIECANTVFKILPLGAKNTDTLSLFWNSKWDVGRHSMSDQYFQGTASANPSNSYFFHVWAIDITAAIDPSPVSAAITIEYDVTFLDPVTPAQS